jgi:hypothetical protein
MLCHRAVRQLVAAIEPDRQAPHDPQLVLVRRRHNVGG